MTYVATLKPILEGQVSPLKPFYCLTIVRNSCPIFRRFTETESLNEISANEQVSYNAYWEKFFQRFGMGPFIGF